MSGILQGAKDTINSLSETVQGKGAEASHEANKNVAKSGDADISTRATAAKDAIGDKMDQKSHEAKSEAYDAKAGNK